MLQQGFLIFIGKYKLRVDALQDCPPEWLDRKIDTETVNGLVQKIEENSPLLCESQSWLAIAAISKEDLSQGQAIKDLLKGCEINLIGGRHRQQAYLKVIMETNLWFIIHTVGVNIYLDSIYNIQGPFANTHQGLARLTFTLCYLLVNSFLNKQMSNLSYQNWKKYGYLSTTTNSQTSKLSV